MSDNVVVPFMVRTKAAGEFTQGDLSALRGLAFALQDSHSDIAVEWGAGEAGGSWCAVSLLGGPERSLVVTREITGEYLLTDQYGVVRRKGARLSDLGLTPDTFR